MPRECTGVCPNTTTSGKPNVASSPMLYAYAARGGSSSGALATGSSAHPFVSIIQSTLSRCSIERSGIGSSLTAPTLPRSVVSHPPCTLTGMEPGATLRFTAAARTLADASSAGSASNARLPQPASAWARSTARCVAISVARSSPSDSEVGRGQPCSRTWSRVSSPRNDLTAGRRRSCAQRLVAGVGRRRPGHGVAQVAVIVSVRNGWSPLRRSLPRSSALPTP